MMNLYNLFRWQRGQLDQERWYFLSFIFKLKLQLLANLSCIRCCNVYMDTLTFSCVALSKPVGVNGGDSSKMILKRFTLFFLVFKLLIILCVDRFYPLTIHQIKLQYFFDVLIFPARSARERASYFNSYVLLKFAARKQRIIYQYLTHGEAEPSLDEKIHTMGFPFRFQ